MASNRRWRCQFRYRGSRHESAVAQLSTLDGTTHHTTHHIYGTDTTTNTTTEQVLTHRFGLGYIGIGSSGFLCARCIRFLCPDHEIADTSLGDVSPRDCRQQLGRTDSQQFGQHHEDIGCDSGTDG